MVGDGVGFSGDGTVWDLGGNEVMNSEKGRRRKEKRRQFCLIYNGRGQEVWDPHPATMVGLP